VTDEPEYELAVILATGEVERLYSGLSVLATTAADGNSPCAALASFRALALLLDPDLGRHAQEPEETPSLSWAGRETFGNSLGELRDLVLELDNVEVWACSASVETMALSPADVEDRLNGVMSTPRFLRRTSTARRLIHV
jgi:peroxiredoxin family protein